MSKNNMELMETPYEGIQQKQFTGDVESSRAIAEVQAMVISAKRFPRDPIASMERILNECRRKGLAEKSLYSYSKGGQDITGPSIRLAETISRNWGNMDAGVKELSRSNGVSEMMSFCWDLETNTRHIKIFNVEHKRDTKKGSYALTDSRDVYEVSANQASRRLRACILALIPADVIDAALEQCEATIKASADTSPDAIKKMVAAFEKLGVKKSQIEKRIQRKIEAITPAQVVDLRKVYNSINDGMSGPEDWFENQSNDFSEAINKSKKKPASFLSAEMKKTIDGCIETDGERFSSAKRQICGDSEITDDEIADRVVAVFDEMSQG